MRCFAAVLAFITLSVWGARNNDDNLTRAFAKQREAQVESVDYDLQFTLNKGEKTYTGKTKILLKLRQTNLALSVDTYQHQFQRVAVNGVELKQYPVRKGSLDIPAKYLKKEMTIEFDFTGKFSTEASGFQRSVDPEDGSEYVFTDFEPYYAHWLFPCLDQPDLKATFKLSVDAPKEWQVIGNDLQAYKQNNGERQFISFKQSKPFSPYLFFMAAGPFVGWEDEAAGVPIHLWARKSLAKYVDHERIMETTKKGLKFYNEYFGHAYPFPKYGQIFIPEFNWGGMENPGAVALNERNIFRGTVPLAKYEGRDSLILHEMAHMWFGDLVTMEWWNDLWLNESFATYLATIAQDRALNSNITWPRFFSTKTWGYWQDQLVSTHPIETPVPDIRTVKGNFDGITYAKGASTLKQLHFMVGEDSFRDGLRDYFKRYAWKNTLRADFIGSIAKSSKMDLNDWTKKWLQTAGPNKVEAKWKCEEGKVSAFALVQLPSVSKTLSPHRTKVGLYDENLKQLSLHEVLYEKGVTEVLAAIGKECPAFVYPNVDDMDYALFMLDPVSLKLAGKVLTDAKEPLMRIMMWNTLEQMMRQAKLAPVAFFELALNGLEKEQDDLLLGLLLGNHSSLRDYYFRYLTPGQRAELAPRMEKVLWARLEQTSDPSLKLTFFDYLITVVQTEESSKRMASLLSGQESIKGVELGQDRRWTMIDTLAASGHASALELIKLEEVKDPSTAGQRSAEAARVAMPDHKVKDTFWKALLTDGAMPFSTLERAAEKFHHWNRPDFTRKQVETYFKRISSMDWKANDSFVEIYFSGLFPKWDCDSKLLIKSQRNMKLASKLTSLAKRSWAEANDELSRCVQARKLVGQSLQLQ